MLKNRTFLAISFAVFVAYVGIGMVIPVRVLYAEAHGASLAIIGLMATSFLVSNFIFQYPMGWLADRLGRKRIMVAGLIGQSLISLTFVIVSDPLAFVVLRLLEGTVAAMLLPPARALIADMTAPDNRGQAYGTFNAFFNASFLLGPGIGSAIATLGYEYVFIGSVVARVLALVVVVLIVPNDQPHAARSEAPMRRVSLRELLSLPLIGAYILVFGDYLYLGFDQTIFPLWMHDHLGASVGVIGLVYIAWSIPTTLLSPLGGRIADRVRRSTLMLIFGGAQIPCYLAYGLMDTAWPILAISFMHGACYALMQPAVDTHLAAAAAEDARARVQGFYSAIGLAGAFVGANGLSAVYEINYRLPLFVLGLGFALCLLIGSIVVRISEARGLVASPTVEAKAALQT